MIPAIQRRCLLFLTQKMEKKTKKHAPKRQNPENPAKSSNPKKDKGSKDREMQMTSDDSYDSWLVFKF